MSIELSRGYLTTPVSTYYNHNTQQRVDVVSTVHFADPAYYEAVQSVLDTSTIIDGAKVHYESLRLASDQDLARVPKRIRNNAILLRTTHANMAGLFDGLGLAYQTQALQPDPNWENHDVTELEIAARSNSLKLGSVALASRAAALKNANLSAEERRELFFSKVIPSGHREHKASWLQRALSNDEVTLGYRNDVALQAADRHFSAQPGRPLTMLWGIGHTPGLDYGLKARNFQKVQEYRLNAISV